MSLRILVTYATRFGSTAEIANQIASVLSSEGAFAYIYPIDDIKSVMSYDAVVIGSPIRGGTWLTEAVDFLKAHRAELSHIPVAYFTVCMTLRQDTPENRSVAGAYHTTLMQEFPDIRPLTVGMFAGRVNYADLSWLLGVTAAASNLPEGDWRNWEQIDAWARDLVPLFEEHTQPV